MSTADRLPSMYFQHLPVEPLTIFVANRGGLAHVLSERYGDAWQGSRDAQAWRTNWHRSLRRGSVTAAWADRFCIELLRIDPLLIWGRAWFGKEVSA